MQYIGIQETINIFSIRAVKKLVNRRPCGYTKAFFAKGEKCSVMSERKQGRRSAEAAEQTKCEILKIAADMFATLGFERVSLRNISERAGVSHSLIRHHFGSKEKIWQEISDALDDYLQTYITELIGEISQQNSDCAQQIYQFLVRMCAFTLVHKQPIQLIADAVRQDDNALLEYFLRSKDEFAAAFEPLYTQYNLRHPEKPICMWEMKWQMLLHAHGACSLTPFLGETWPGISDADTLLLKHWELFNQQIARQLDIQQDKMIHPNKLDDIVIEVACRTQ